MKDTMNLFEENTDLLSQVEAISVDNTQRISSQDKEYCELVQNHCHKALSQLEDSLREMMAQSEPYIRSGIVQIKYEDTYDHSYYEYDIKDVRKKYMLKHYVPCMQEKTIRKLFTETCRMFTTDIIGYFNNRYGISMHDSETYRNVPGINDFDPTFRPKYQDIVDMVIAHLGGRTFAQTMEDEVYANALRDYEKNYMSVKGAVVSIEHYAHTHMFDTDLNYETRGKIERLSDAITLFFTGVRSTMSTSQLFQICHNPRQGETYRCAIPEIVHFRFYKNDKMEIRFRNASDAQKFYERIKNNN